MKLKLFAIVLLSSLLILGVNTFLYLNVDHESLQFVKILPLFLICNGLFLVWLTKHALSYILFPFASSLLKNNYHSQMNHRMVTEVSSTLLAANEIIQDRMNKTTYSKYETFREYRMHSTTIKKMCDYVSLFSEVNRELIEGDKRKKARNKNTSRYKITQHFV